MTDETKTALLSKLRAPVADESLVVQALKSAQSNIAAHRPPGSSDPESPRYDHDAFVWDYYQRAIDFAALASAPVAGEALTRFCPECGHVGDVGSGYRSCCPDGGSARMVPKSLADKCRATFQLAIKSDAAPQASEAVRDAGIAASEDVELPPLPKACIESRQTDSTMRTTVLHTYDEQDMKVYAYDAVLADRQQDAIAWESTTPAYIKFITDSRYRKFSPAVRKWYRPYRCATCAALSAQPGAQNDA